MDKTKTPLRCVNISTQLGASSQPKRRDSEQQQERTSSFFAKLELQQTKNTFKSCMIHLLSDVVWKNPWMLECSPAIVLSFSVTDSSHNELFSIHQTSVTCSVDYLMYIIT